MKKSTGLAIAVAAATVALVLVNCQTTLDGNLVGVPVQLTVAS